MCFVGYFRIFHLLADRASQCNISWLHLIFNRTKQL